MLFFSKPSISVADNVDCFPKTGAFELRYLELQSRFCPYLTVGSVDI